MCRAADEAAPLAKAMRSRGRLAPDVLIALWVAR